MEAFSDSSIKAIISTLGGDDSIRLLPYLDFDTIRENPKIFLGYSDTTISHFACYKAGIVSFYGPAIMVNFAENGGMFSYMVSSIRRTLFNSEIIGEIEPNRDGWTVEFLDWADRTLQNQKRKLNPNTGWKFLQGKGVITGALIGGCLECLEFIKGTELWPGKNEWDGKILFLETSEEAPSPVAVTRFLRNLTAQGILERLGGVIFGRPGGQIPPEEFINYDQAILKVLDEEMGLLDIPVITHMDFGHTDPMFILPYGIKAQIDCETEKFTITENAVTG
jgi:muramoyltetrapeptide carboxypeptidase LdcA involved in peptidoglycan recycling